MSITKKIWHDYTHVCAHIMTIHMFYLHVDEKLLYACNAHVYTCFQTHVQTRVETHVKTHVEAHGYTHVETHACAHVQTYV